MATCGLHLRRLGTRPSGLLGPALAAGFGLIHGAGFANYPAEMFSGPRIGPLLGFNLGIEVGQLVVVAGLVATAAMVGRPRVTGALASVGAGALAIAVAATRWPVG